MESYFQKLARQAQENVEKARRGLEEKRPDLERMLDGIKHAAEDLHQKTLGNRDPRTRGPPTASELATQDLCYITDRLISSAFPVDRTKSSMKGNDLDVVAALLRHRHPGHYMVWNISEDSYEYGNFEDQVLEFRFPGHPAPPLGMLFKICTAIESWLVADPLNVALVHCLTGKGRTATVIACFLAWVGDCGNPTAGLQWVAQRQGSDPDRLTVPSQRRYMEYFANMLDGARPRGEPLVLRRVIMNGIPSFGLDAPPHAGSSSSSAADGSGCCPYIQLFKNGRLIFTTAATAASVKDTGSDGAKKADEESALTWIYTSDESVSFTVDCAMQGDVLLRCRHLGANGERQSMFRAAFHTGYVPCGVLRLGKSELDGASNDDRFGDDFFLDLIFSTVDGPSDIPSPLSKKGGVEEGGVVVDPDAAEAYDAMLHRDARFWDELAERKARRMSLPVPAVAAPAEARSQPEPPPPPVEQGNVFSISADAEEDDHGERGRRGSRMRPGAKKEGEARSDKEDSHSDLLAELAALEVDEAQDESAVSTPPAAPAPVLTATEAAATQSRNQGREAELSREMQALEDLERELGIDDLGLGDMDDGVVDAGALDADLDELEGYLESLAGAGS